MYPQAVKTPVWSTMLAERSNSIHSGHFMVSCIHEADDDGELVGNVKPETDRQGYNFEAADWQLRKTYVFGNRSTNALAIDASLTKLFECMTLAYRLASKCVNLSMDYVSLLAPSISVAFYRKTNPITSHLTSHHRHNRHHWPFISSSSKLNKQVKQSGLIYEHKVNVSQLLNYLDDPQGLNANCWD